MDGLFAASPNIGTGITVTVTGLSLLGADATNYALTQPAGLKADITSPVAQLLIFIAATNGGAFLRATGSPGRTYVVQSALTLGQVVWTDLSGPLVANGAGQISFTDPTPPSRRFYRARTGP